MNTGNKMIHFPQRKEMLLVTVLVHNVRSLPRHADDIVNDNRMINNDIIGSIETQIKPSDSTSKIIETFNFFQY